MNTQRYSKFFAVLGTSLILLSLLVNSAEAAAGDTSFLLNLFSTSTLAANKGSFDPIFYTGKRITESAVPLETSFTLDGVFVSVQASSLPSTDFVVSAPGSASQVATSVAWQPYREFSVTAIPFGSKPGTEALPVAETGEKPAYDNELRSYRLQQGGQVQDGPTISLFGQQISGLHSLVDLFIGDSVPKPVVIEEWVVEAGDRLWIIRSSQEQSTSDPSIQSNNLFGDLVLNSSTLNNPSTINDQVTQSYVMDLNQDGTAANLPSPAWWSGDCDNNNYITKSGGIASKRLGAVYLNLPACGPRPAFESAPEVLVHFFTGSWGEYEWECVELSMRFLYLMYGIAPYSANGKDVVNNYSGNQLVKIPNGIAGQAPEPNDVLSYGPDKTYGHTSVVTGSSVDENGNGTVTVIEQNNSSAGSSTLTVSGWSVAGNAGSVSGWLQANTLPLSLAITKAGTGGGTVTSSPAGINCGSTCWYAFAYNTAVTLTATPTSPSVFGGWSGGGCSGTSACTITVTAAASVTATFTRKAQYDFNGDGATDIAVWRPSTGMWYVHGGAYQQWGSGAENDIPVPGDYNGDGTTDMAVWRPSSGMWYVYGGDYVQWGSGAENDIPVPGDYNGDGTTEMAVWRPGTGMWYVYGGDYMQWGSGAENDIPVPGDYNGDGVTEMAVWRPSTGMWYVYGGSYQQWGTSGDIPVPGDYNGDGKTEMAVWRPSTGMWYVYGGSYQQWGSGTVNDIPVPGDYNGDGVTEMAVWRPGTGMWYVYGGVYQQWGTSGDIPLPEMGTGKASTAP